jgi:hypothetical protein
MLTIRREQLHVFETYRTEFWVSQSVESISRSYPRQYAEMGPSGAREFVYRAIAKGRTNHVGTAGGIGVLIELMIQFGEEFQNSRDKAWADRFLANPKLPPELKMTLMYNRMTEVSQGRVIVPFTPVNNSGGPSL